VTIVLATSAVVDAKFAWYLGMGGGSCTDSCAALNKRCVPVQLPTDAVEMDSLSIEAHFVCGQIRKQTSVFKPDYEPFLPAFYPATAAIIGGNDEKEADVGICWYGEIAQHTEGDFCGEVPNEKNMQRFCPCSEVLTLQWLVSNEGQDCDAACRASDGICDDVSTQWPENEKDMQEVIRSAGVSCSSITLGENTSDPSFSSAGNQCRWKKGGPKRPACYGGERTTRRFCPCWDVVRQN